jgi:ATP-binding cassette subfamily B (MDR/TAP) protein 1
MPVPATRLSHVSAAAIQYMCTFLIGLIIGFVRSWQLTLLICAFVPFMIVVGAGMRVSLARLETLAINSYAHAGSIASEVLGNIRAVVANNGEEAEVARYNTALEPSEKAGQKKSLMTGAGFGSFMLVMFASYAVGMRLGATLIQWNRRDHPSCVRNPTGSDCFTGAMVLSTFFAVLLGSMTLGQMAPAIAAGGGSQGYSYNHAFL